MDTVKHIFSFDEPIFLLMVHSKSKLIHLNLLEENILRKTTFKRHLNYTLIEWENRKCRLN